MPKPELSNQTAVLFVKEIEVSKAFYNGLLGLDIDLDMGKNVILKGGLTLWEVFPEQVIPQTLGMAALEDRSANRFEVCFETSDIDALSELLVTNKIELLHPLHEEPWGQRTIRFFDPDHHLIEVGESLKTFITRLANSGLSLPQVSQKTGMTIQDIQKYLQ